MTIEPRKERPILFSGEMVRAILDGRKTQTRRVVKLSKTKGVPREITYCGKSEDGSHNFAHCFQWTTIDDYLDCPYGQPGDRLWVVSMKDIPGYEGVYCAGDDGQIYRYNGGIYRGPLREATTSSGYKRVSLNRDGTQKNFTVHSLVCSAFYGKPSDGMVVRHLDGDRRNNTPGNLDWGTPEQNWQDRKFHGKGVREEHHNAKLNQVKADTIRSDSRTCWAIAKDYGVTSKTIKHIKDGRTWMKPVPCPPNLPRWASRITLEITNVRVERVQEISESDALAEGVEGMWRGDFETTPRETFKGLWNSVYPCSWDSNDWVWVIDFRIIK